MKTSIGAWRIFLISLFLSACSGSMAQMVFSDWIGTLGGKGWDIVNDITCDTSGNVYITGSIADTISGAKKGSGASYFPSCFIAKYDTSGKLIWKKNVVTAAEGYGSRLAITADNTILIAGGFLSDHRSSTGNHKAMGFFLSCLNTKGETEWAQSLTGTRLDGLTSLITDPLSGDIIVTGYFKDSIRVNGHLYSSLGKTDAIILRYSGDGSFRHSITATGKGEDRFCAAAFDDSGNFVVAGTFQRELALTEKTRLKPEKSGETGLMIAGYDPSDSLRQARLIAQGKSIRVNSLIKGKDCFYVAGSFSEKMKLFAKELASVGGDDIFIACLDKNFQEIWTKQIGGPRKDRLAGMIASDDELILCGSFTSVLQADSVNMLSATSGPDVFVLSLKPSGGLSWYRTLGSEADDYPQGIRRSGGEFLYLTGSYRHEMKVNDMGIKALGEEDIFLARLENCREKAPVFDSPVEICRDGEITLDAGGGFVSYNWDNGESLEQTYTVNKEGDYSLELVSESGCRIFDTITVAEIPPPAIFLGNDTILADTGSLVLDAGGPYASYRWNNGTANRKNTVHGFDFREGPNLVWVEVSTADSCTGSGEIYITVIKTTNDEDSDLLAGNCTVFPNPADDQITVVITSSFEPLHIRIYNQLGNEVCIRHFNEYQAGTAVVFDVGNLSPGLYTLTAATGSGYMAKKIILY